MSDQRVIQIDEIGRLLEDVNRRLESLKRLRFVVSTIPEREVEKGLAFFVHGQPSGDIAKSRDWIPPHDRES